MMINQFWIIDTNTLVSALFSMNSSPGKALIKARETGTLLVSPETSDEYFAVFTRPKFDKYLSLHTRIAFLENILTHSLSIKLTETVTICRDPKDNMFLSLALSASADGVITGDKDLLILNPFNNIPIVSPAEFIARF